MGRGAGRRIPAQRRGKSPNQGAAGGIAATQNRSTARRACPANSISSLNSVSICIPVYNGAPYLAAALASAQAQDHQALEILIVDDGSSDESVSIARAAAAQDSRLTIVCNPANLGLVGNWNRCVELARGTWIKFLFQDDLLQPDCVSSLLARGAQGSPFVACDRDFLFESDAADLNHSSYLDSRRQINALLAPAGGCSAQEFGLHALRGLHFNLVGEPTVTLIRRDLMTRTGPFNPALVQLCDTEYWLRLGCQVGVGYVARPLATFRVHGRAATARNSRGAAFVADSLDKLALAHTAATAPECAPLRRLAARPAAGFVDGNADGGARRAIPLVSAFRQRANQVHEWAAQHADEACGDDTVRGAYGRFLDRCPGCAVNPLAHAVWRLRRSLWQLRRRAWA